MKKYFKKVILHGKIFLKQIHTFYSKTFYVFGDSHTEVFKFISEKEMIPFVKFDVLTVLGATAQGMRNPNSYTNSLNIFEDKINSLNKKATLIFQLGEVDTGFVIWYRAKKYNENVTKQLQDSITSYSDFIRKLKYKGYKKIWIIAAPLPTIKDNQDWGNVANLRKEITASQIERTKLTIAYNNQLRVFCKENKIRFIDTDDLLIDESTKIINQKYLNKDKTDHHLDTDMYSKVIVKLINKKN